MTQTRGQTPEERFGEQVREARERRDWTQEELRRRLREAFGLDLSQTAMTRLENGRRPIRLNEVEALAKVLGLDLAPYAGDPLVPVLATPDGYEKARAALAAYEQLIASLEESLASMNRSQQELLEDIGRCGGDLGAARTKRDWLARSVADYERRGGAERKG